MGPNVAGVIGSAVAAGVLLALVGNSAPLIPIDVKAESVTLPRLCRRPCPKNSTLGVRSRPALLSRVMPTSATFPGWLRRCSGRLDQRPLSCVSAGTKRGRQWSWVRFGWTLRLRCQRCLGEVTWQVDAPIALALVRAASESDRLGLVQVHGVADHLDPLSVGDEPISPLDLIEDELLLALPQVPRHQPGDCVATLCRNAGPRPRRGAGREDR